MKKTFSILILTFLFVICIIFMENGFSENDSYSDRFLKKYDTNNDGQVELSEFDGAKKRFNKWDINGDGFIAGEELDSLSDRFRKDISGQNNRELPSKDGVGPAHQGRLFISRFDQNGDQLVSKEEFTGNKNRFEQLDKNRDGNISIEEYSSIAGKQKDQSKTQNNPKKKFREELKELMVTIDEDGSESLSLEEFKNNSKLLFEVLDRNGDQQLDGFELGIQSRSKSDHHNTRSRRMSPEERADRMIRSMDVDNNGFIDIEEWRGPEEAFHETDLDQNNLINTTELIESRTFEHQAQRKIKYLMRQHDQNGDGQISEDEFKGSTVVFNKMDLNQDGYIVPEEMKQIAENLHARYNHRN